jgi:hypothetical protein
MNVGAVVVEHIDYDGYLRTLQMLANPGQTLTIAFADAFDEPHSGPFHFLDERHKKNFEKEFAECETLKLSESSFKIVNDEYHFNTSWHGIPTDATRLSCYSLSLPEFAVPSSIQFKDPHSGREYSKSIVRDDSRNRFVAYLECRSSYGSFDFLLEVTFRRDHAENFRTAKYSDECVAAPDGQINAYESLVPHHLQGLVKQFLSPNFPTLQPLPKGSPSQPGLFPPVTLISTDRIEIIGGAGSDRLTESKGSKRKGADALPPKKHDMSNFLDGAKLTDAQREVAILAWEYELSVSEIARRLGKHRASIEERLSAAQKKVNEAQSSQKHAMRRAAHPE